MQVRRLTGVVGAEITDIQLADAIDDPALAAAIEERFVEHGVLFFRDQELDRDRHVAFGRLFGEVHIHPYAANLGPDYPEIIAIQSDRLNGFLPWHVDATFEERPPVASILLAREVPSYGGDTLFASAAAAYDALSPVMQQLLDGLVAVHTSSMVFGRGRYEEHEQSEARTTRHPLVRVHPGSGRKVLYVNSQFTSHIEGMHAEESAALLDFLIAHIAHPRFQVRFNWEPGSVAMWDNRQVQHAVIGDFDDAEGRRRMERVAVMAAAS